MSRPWAASERTVRAIQWAMAGAAVCFIGGIVIWITHLIRTAWRLGDGPSASIGISLVAIPVFLTLLGVILYVFRGLLAETDGRIGPRRQPPEPETVDEQEGGV